MILAEMQAHLTLNGDDFDIGILFEENNNKSVNKLFLWERKFAKCEMKTEKTRCRRWKHHCLTPIGYG